MRTLANSWSRSVSSRRASASLQLCHSRSTHGSFVWGCCPTICVSARAFATDRKPAASDNSGAQRDEKKSSPSPSTLSSSPRGLESAAHLNPSFYSNVPAQPHSQTIGRGNEILSLWQKILGGCRCIVIEGVDGLGKSALAAELAECARKSNTFTCIQWFDARQRPVQDQLRDFIRSMRGRQETQALLIVDNLPSVDASTLSLLPTHDKVVVIAITNGVVDRPATLRANAHVLEIRPLDKVAALQFRHPLADVDEASFASIAELVRRVPLLLSLAAKVLRAGAVSAEVLRDELQAQFPLAEGDADASESSLPFSVTRATTAIVRLALRGLRTDWGDEACKLIDAAATLADTGLTAAILESLCVPRESATQLHRNASPVMSTAGGEEETAGFGDDSSEVQVRSARAVFEVLRHLEDLGLLMPSGSDADAYDIHHVVQRALREVLAEDRVKLEETVGWAAKQLLSLWPRRWRHAAAGVGEALARHTDALQAFVAHERLPFPPDLLAGVDRAAAYSANSDVPDLERAARLWQRLLNHFTEAGVVSDDSARVARECGRVMHRLRHEDAEEVLATAFEHASQLYGSGSVEASVVMAYLGLYLDETDETLKRLRVAEHALRARCHSVDELLSQEDAKMLHSLLVVVLVRQAQIAQTLGMTQVAESAQSEANNVRKAIGRLNAAPDVEAAVGRRQSHRE